MSLAWHGHGTLLTTLPHLEVKPNEKQLWELNSCVAFLGRKPLLLTGWPKDTLAWSNRFRKSTAQTITVWLRQCVSPAFIRQGSSDCMAKPCFRTFSKAENNAKQLCFCLSLVLWAINIIRTSMIPVLINGRDRLIWLLVCFHNDMLPSNCPNSVGAHWQLLVKRLNKNIKIPG